MNRRIKLRLSAAIALVAMTCIMPAAAQLRPCKMPLPGGYKIFVDEFHTSAAGDSAELKNLNEAIGIAVNSSLAEVKLQLLETKLTLQSTPDIVVVPCDPKRSPSGTTSFTKTELKALTDSRVLLETWGYVSNAQSGTAHMGYALAPARLVDLPAVHSIPEAVGSGDILKLFEENKTLRAYTEIVLGIQFYRNDEFEAAVGYLCNGALKLEADLSERGNTTAEEKLFQAQQASLIKGVRALGADAIQKLQASSTSTTSSDTLIPACPKGKEN